jgi:hypothetical protein
LLVGLKTAKLIVTIALVLFTIGFGRLRKSYYEACTCL